LGMKKIATNTAGLRGHVQTDDRSLHADNQQTLWGSCQLLLPPLLPI